jgi:hypothetical protein
MIFGDIFAVFILHPNNARIGEAMYAAAQLIPAGDSEGILSHFMAIGGFLENRGTKIDAHSHIIHTGYAAILLAILQPYVALNACVKIRLAWIYILSALLMPPCIFAIYYVGMAYSPLQDIGWASIFADLFGAFLAIAVFGQLWGLYRHWHSNSSTAAPHYLKRGGEASRSLLVGGLMLLIAGFLYGAGFAAYNQSGASASEVDILKNIVSHAASSQNDLLNEDFAAFGGYQALRGITIAAHAHVNEMGILLLLLSFVQPFLLYSNAWKKRWARVAVVGAFGMPVSIAMELKFGLLAGFFADSFGLTVIIALVAMLFGLLRYTGSKDGHEGEYS